MRYKRRGVDKNGNVANYVETEQLIHVHNHTLSYIQTRGSVPVFWSQVGYRYNPRPRLDKSEYLGEKPKNQGLLELFFWKWFMGVWCICKRMKQAYWKFNFCPIFAQKAKCSKIEERVCWMPDFNSNVEAEQINETPLKVILYKVIIFKLRYLGFFRVQIWAWFTTSNRTYCWTGCFCLTLLCLVGENETVPCFRAHFEEQLKNYKKQVSATWQNSNLIKMQRLKVNVFRLFFLVMCCGFF